MAGNLNISVVLGLVDKLSGPLRGVLGNLDRIGGKLRDAGAKTAIAGGAASLAGQQILAPLREAVAASMEVQSGLTEVAIVAGKTAAEVGAIRPELAALSREFGRDQIDLVRTLGDITAKGLDFDVAQAALPEVTRSAAALNAELSDMEASASAMIAQLAVDPKRLADPYNRMAAAANAGGFEVRDMARYFPELAASMAKLDTGADSVGTLAAALQIVNRGAGSTGQAATQMGDMLEKMFAPATVEALEEKFGVDLPAAMQQWKAEGKDVFDEYIGMMQKVTGGDAFKAAEIYGDKEGRAGLMSLMRNWEDFKRIRAEATAAAGAGSGEDLIGSMFAQRMAEDPALRLARIGQSIKALQLQIGSALLPVVDELAPRIEKALGAAGQWIENNRELAGKIAIAAGALGLMGVVLGPIVMGIGAIIGGFGVLAGGLGMLAGPVVGAVAMIGKLGCALSLLKTGLLTNPITWIVLGIVAAVAAVVLVFRNWEQVTQAAGTAYAWLVEQLGFDPIAAVQAKWSALTGFFSDLWSSITAGFDQGFIQGVINLLHVANPVTVMIDLFRTLAPEAYAAIAAVASGILERLRSILSWETLKSIGSNIMKGLADGIAGAAKWAWDAAVGAATTLVSKTRAAVDEHSPSRVFAAIGANLMRGLAVGIDAMSGLPMASLRTVAAAAAAVPMTLAPMAPATAELAPPTLSARDTLASLRIDDPASRERDARRAQWLDEARARAASVSTAMPSAGLAIDDYASRERDARRAQWLDQARERAASVSTRPSGPAAIGAASGSETGGQRAAPNVSMPITITVSAAPGADGQQIAELVRRQIEEAAGQSIRHLSALFDDPDDV